MIPITDWIRPGDTVFWSQGTAEPRTLTEALVAQRSAVAGTTVLLAQSFSDTLAPEHADALRFVGLGGLGTLARLSRAGVLDVLPLRQAGFAAMLRRRDRPVDVVFVQVSPPDARGVHSLGLAADLTRDALTGARLVVAEVNAQVPVTHGDTAIDASAFDAVVRSDREPVTLPVPAPGPRERVIGARVAARIPDGATLQLGLGSIPTAVAGALADRRDLRLHSGFLGEDVRALVEAGVVRTPAVGGTLLGSMAFYAWAHRNPAVELRPVSYTHDPRVLAGLDRFVAVNGALEVDVTGAVNAETAGGRHVGAAGGQPDFARAAAADPDGLSIVALPSTTRDGASRVVGRVDTVTTPRHDIDVVVTEHGVADLRGATLDERRARLIAVADPAHRASLDMP